MTSQAESVTPAFEDYEWFDTADPRNGACIRIRPGRVDLGLKGFDKRRGGSGYIAVPMTAVGLRDLRAAIDRALGNLA